MDETHNIYCLMQRGYLIRRHDMVVRHILARISARKHPDTVSHKLGTVINGMKPDIVSKLDNN